MGNELQTNKIQVPVVLVDTFKKLGITDDEASSLMTTFGVPLTEAGAILDTYKDIVVSDESQTKEMAEAKEKRLALKKIRNGVENTRKELKDEHLRKGNAIQAVANYIKEEIEPAEEYLELQEKFVEIRNAEKSAILRAERIEKLLKYTDDISMYNIDGIEDATFEFLLTKVKKEYDDNIAAEKAEQERIEKERLAEVARQKEVEAENAKLKAEAEARETQLAIERKEIADKQAEIDAVKEKELLQERAKVEAERAKREKLESDQRKKEVAEAQAKEEADKAERNALLAPDKEKLIQFANGLDLVRTSKLPALKTKQAQDILNEVELRLSQLFNYIMDEAKKL